MVFIPHMTMTMTGEDNIIINTKVAPKEARDYYTQYLIVNPYTLNNRTRTVDSTKLKPRQWSLLVIRVKGK